MMPYKFLAHSLLFIINPLVEPRPAGEGDFDETL